MRHLKMWTAVSASRWICLLVLAVVMLSSAPQVDSFPMISLPCCYKVNTTEIPKVIKCYEQTPRWDCNHHAFLVKNRRTKTFKCISPDAQWLKDMIEQGKVKCPRVTESA